VLGPHAGHALVGTAENRVGALAEVQIEQRRMFARLLQRRAPLFRSDRLVVGRFQFDPHQRLVAQPRQRHRQRVALNVLTAADQNTAVIDARQRAQQPAETAAACLHTGCTHPFQRFHLHGGFCSFRALRGRSSATAAIRHEWPGLSYAVGHERYDSLQADCARPVLRRDSQLDHGLFGHWSETRASGRFHAS